MGLSRKLIVLSLTGKLLIVPGSTRAQPTARPANVSENVLVALIGLGWNERTAALAVDEAVAVASDDELAAMPALLRLALTKLGPAQAASGSGS